MGWAGGGGCFALVVRVGRNMAAVGQLIIARCEVVEATTAFCTQDHEPEKACDDDDSDERDHSFGGFAALFDISGKDVDAEPAYGTEEEAAKEADGSPAFFI